MNERRVMDGEDAAARKSIRIIKIEWNLREREIELNAKFPGWVTINAIDCRKFLLIGQYFEST